MCEDNVIFIKLMYFQSYVILIGPTKINNAIVYRVSLTVCTIQFVDHFHVLPTGLWCSD